MKKLNVLLTVVLLLVLFVQYADAQDKINAITTGVPFLTIGPDAIAGGKGDVGAASAPDLFSQHWNPAKYAFIEEDMGIGISYTPWLRRLVTDIGLSSLAFYKRLDDVQTISASLNYFSLGEIFLTYDDGSSMGQSSPNEFSVDVAYTRLLSENFSGSVALRIINSDFALMSEGWYPGFAYASDVAFYYQKEIRANRKNSLLSAGINISNIGSKITYNKGNTKDFIPTNLRLGVGYKTEIDKYNVFAIYVDANKLLVKTPNADEAYEEYSGTSVIAGMFQSFSDAPGGMKEELQEVSLSAGAEYVYNKQFTIRAGYNHEDAYKGNRKYATVGAGLKMNVFALDFSYLISMAQNNPLDNTLRFTLSFDFEAFNKQRR
ncbi:MAG: type IX secretion system outer membrane channel protein PorV [Bacteroidota bacterium]|nr:type IX secretion system outer membrane channel protein PorV [Bacteroidota bacterium]